MKKTRYSVISGTGSYIPSKKVTNDSFLQNEFLTTDGKKIEADNKEIISKFEEITGIKERRYAEDNHVASDLAYFAAKDALESSKIDKESLDYIIVAHNFGDVRFDKRWSDFVPSLAARVKQKLRIKNPKTIAYDIIFGCPGWLQGVIQADYFLKSGDAGRAMIIGTETLSRVADPHDRDSMIYSDGAGATIIDSVVSKKPVGILSHSTRSDTFEYADMLTMNSSYNSEYSGAELFVKMNGRKLYEYAINTVPQLVKDTIEKAKLLLQDISKVLIHQANEKMDEAILKRVFKLFDEKVIPQHIMPMIISNLGNNSVATLPVLLDMIFKEKLDYQRFIRGDFLAFASVGAGMNINSLIYRVP
ncbi:MAG: ketoacyl-ACP synthase III [Deltaproteobacteria bacterium]|nr:ketoacyl-ACP synthase III [Deltaproteobacteria bacterium]